MNLTQKLLRLMLMLAISWSVVGCSDDKTGPDVEGPYVQIELLSAAAHEVSVAFIPIDVTPSMYAYQIFEAAEAPEILEGNDVFKNGVQAPVSSNAIVISELKAGTDYRIFAVAMSENGVTRATYLDCATAPAVEATEDGIGVEVTAVSDRTFSYKLSKGKNVTAGRVLVYPKVQIENFLDDFLAQAEAAGAELTREDGIRDIMTNTLVHLTNRVSGDEAVDYAGLVMPDLDYYIMTLGLTGDAEEFLDKEPGDIITLELTTVASPLDPTVEARLTAGRCNYRQANWNVWISGTTYGYMRFVTDKVQIDEYMQRGHTERDLSDFVRSIDYLMLMQNRSENDIQGLTINPEDNSATRVETINPSSDIINGAPGLELTCLVVGVDQNYMCDRTVQRVDVTLPEKPDHSAATVEINIREVSATGFKADFIFNDDCRTCYYELFPAGTFEAEYKDSPENQKMLINTLVAGSGKGASRMAPYTSDAPVDPMYTEPWHNWLDPNTSYEIIATCVDYDGILNEELWVSEPFTSLPLVYGGSKYKLKLESFDVSRDSFGVYVGLDPEWIDENGLEAEGALNTAYVMVRKATEAAPSAAQIRSGGDIWHWFEKYAGTSWSMTRPGFKYGSDSYKWVQFWQPDTEYVIYATADDRDGHVLDVASYNVKTKAKVLGKDPRVTELSFLNMTPTSFDYRISVNDQTDYANFICVALDSGRLSYDPDSSDPNKSDKQTLIDDLKLLLNNGLGMPMHGESILITNVTNLVTPGSTHYLAAIAYGAVDDKGVPYTHFNYAEATTPLE
ncbi:MAG: hypothetical protein K2H81_00425 [Alistipes sp.]|nr:hypothetical protein [Alistipes sp.]